ncbi:helix-turn-helix domain-containing protein [Planomonospora sp. ID82291]|uniref:helix-turn-helix domain-containing protein n=1 Tax=Planomonospora sp. ID82291 TaxID=2738136 RepID=UPI0018C41F09|nr:hypothetical protein [Planomonospora sp. ID82291]MBG0818983.1 hypothetical protein [Planomonospora sp. ID82291]
MTTLPPETRSRAAVLYQQGVPIRQLAAHFGVSYGCARAALLNAGVPLRQPGRPRKNAPLPPAVAVRARPRPPFDAAAAARLYEDGKTLEQIAEKTGYSRSRVHVLLRQAGVTMRTSRDPRASRISPAKRRKILALWRQGRSCAHIIERARTSSATITKVVREAGLDPRSRGPRRKYDHERMRALRREGMKLIEIAADQGTTPQYVWTVVNAPARKAKAAAAAGTAADAT